jgi:hypothetical protein
MFPTQKIYIGHGMGNTIMFNALSNNLDFYTGKVNLFLALSPQAYTYNISSTFFSIIY